MTHSHSHSHSHHHSQSQSSGHGHSHDESPYSRSCESPTAASTYSFIASFLGALSSVSLPTHITGYFLPTLPQTILLWSIVVFGFVYSGLTATVFFKILEEAVSDTYDSTLVVEYSQGRRRREKKQGNGKKLRVLRLLSWSSLASLVMVLICSIGFFILGSRMGTEEWLEFCTNRALLVVTSSDSTSDSSTHSSDHTSENPKMELCTLMELNQTYLVLGIPIIILTIEILRHLNTLSFAELASEQEVVERAPRLEVPDLEEKCRGRNGSVGGGASGRAGRDSQRELGRSRRSRRKYRNDDSESEDESEMDRLLSV